MSQPPGVCSPTTRSSVSPGCRSRSETEQTPGVRADKRAVLKQEAGCCVSTVARTCLGKLLPKLSAEGLRVETARYVAKHAIHVVSRPTRHPRPHFPRLVPHACFMAPRRLSAQLCKGSFECSVVLTGPLVLCGEVVLCFECSRHLSTCRALSSTPHQYDQSKKGDSTESGAALLQLVANAQTNTIVSAHALSPNVQHDSTALRGEIKGIWVAPGPPRDLYCIGHTIESLENGRVHARMRPSRCWYRLRSPKATLLRDHPQA